MVENQEVRRVAWIEVQCVNFRYKISSEELQ